MVSILSLPIMKIIDQTFMATKCCVMSARATSEKHDRVVSCPITQGERHSHIALGGAILGGSGQPGDVSALCPLGLSNVGVPCK